MGENAGGGGQASFDGVLKAWPEDKALSISNVPKEKKDFVLTLACDIFKNNKIEEPRKQANEAIDHATALYNALKSKGYI